MTSHPTITSKLLKDQKNGAKIVCAQEPYDGREVVHDPGMGYSRSHPFPWVLLGTGLRFNGRQVRAQWPEGKQR